MNQTSICIMLVDDNRDDNFFHERAIKKNNPATIVVSKSTALEALEYLRSNRAEDRHPDLIFLDINMPGVNGWEFLEEYNRLDRELQSRAVVIMLTTSSNPDDVAKAKVWPCVSEYRIKPLTHDVVKELIAKYFHGYGLEKGAVLAR